MKGIFSWKVRKALLCSFSERNLCDSHLFDWKNYLYEYCYFLCSLLFFSQNQCFFSYLIILLMFTLNLSIIILQLACFCNICSCTSVYLCLWVVCMSQSMCGTQRITSSDSPPLPAYLRQGVFVACQCVGQTYSA